MKTIALYASLLSVAVTAASAQNSVNGPQVLVLSGLKSDTSSSAGFVYREVMRGGEFVKSAPYSAIALTETTQVFRDGNRIVNKSVSSLARDSEGRTRREETVSNFGPLPTAVSKLAFITDPVARAEYVLDLDNHIAHVQQLRGVKIIALEQKHASGSNPGAPFFSADTVADVKQQALPNEHIDGVSCEHIVETQTIPAGSIGNDRQIIITSETCASPDLHLLLMRKRSDPRYGNTVYRLTGIRRAEPDAALFKIPSNFKVLKNSVPPGSGQ